MLKEIHDKDSKHSNKGSLFLYFRKKSFVGLITKREHLKFSKELVFDGVATKIRDFFSSYEE